MPSPPFPTLVTRAQNGAPLTDTQMDANWLNLRAYCLTLANLLSSSINPDGTLVGNSVGSQALQAAAVTLAALNPALLYSIVPVDTDIGTANSYAITARGGVTGSNIVPGGQVYNGSGNYVLTGVMPNYGYYWAKNTNDISLVANINNTISTSGAFVATNGSVTLTGTPGQPVTATVVQSAPVSSYQSGQMFFVWAGRGNTGSATLNVNNIGPVPILLNGQPLQSGQISASSLIAVVYMNGAFNLFSGSGSNSSGSSSTGSTSNLNYTFNGTTLFSTGQLPYPTTAISLNHGFGTIPISVAVVLQKIASDGTDSKVSIGQNVPIGEFLQGSPSEAAFVVSYDSNVITVTPTGGTVNLGGTNITSASWTLVVNATKQTNISNYVFPPLSYAIQQPEGAFCYNGVLVVFNTGKNSNKVWGNAINLTNNEVTPLTAPATGQPQQQNHALFKRANGTIESIFTSNAGIYHVTAAAPTVNIVPGAQSYNGSGYYALSISPGTAYSIIQGANDAAYALSTQGVTPPSSTSFTNLSPTTNISNLNTQTWLWLQGTASASVTAQVMGPSSTWQPAQLLTNTGLPGSKPVWITESPPGTINGIYVVASSMGKGSPVNSIPMQLVAGTSGAGTVSTIGTNLDLTNTGIANITQFNTWHFGVGATVVFFQYNSITKRIYVVTNEMRLIHIFQITGSFGTGGNDITSFWTNASRYAGLTYIKSLALSAEGPDFSNAPWESNMVIEIDQNSGLEKSIVFTRYPAGVLGNTVEVGSSVTRVPWVE